MNKTIIININGMVFHIEEDAYEVLKSYMTDIKRHFSYSVDSEEIITDIENRLAEMFNERLSSQSKQVIVLADVQEITAIMGSVADFANQHDDSEAPRPASTRRLYRDPDDKAIAGVCAGLAHYLQMETKWVRVITVILTLFTGIGVIPYFLFWIIVPEANTRQEKMAMRGEALNLQNFKKTFETDSFNQTGKFQEGAHFGDRIENVFTSILNFVGRVLKIIIKGVGLVVVIMGIVVLIGLLMVALFGIGFLSDAEMDHIVIRAINPEYLSPICFSGFILIIVPLAALIGFAIRVIFNFRLISRTGSFAMLVLWLTGLGMGIYYGSRIAAEFKQEASFEQQSDIAGHNVYYLKLNRDLYLTQQDSAELNLDERKLEGKILVNDHNEFSDLRFALRIDKSENGKADLIQRFEARGRSFENALLNARGISYRVADRDSVLLFDKYFRLTDDTPYRDQEVTVTLQIPVGTILMVDREVAWRLHNFDIGDCDNEEEDRAVFKLIMTDEGLKCHHETAQKESATTTPPAIIDTVTQ